MEGNTGFAALVIGGMALVGGSVWMLTAPASPSTAAAAPLPARAVYYSGCNDVRAAGAAPLHRGEPGYRPEMDGDGDGVACEAHGGTRSFGWGLGRRRRR